MIETKLGTATCSTARRSNWAVGSKTDCAERAANSLCNCTEFD